MRYGISERDFTPDGWAGLRRWCEAADDGPFPADRLDVSAPENWAWIFFELRQATDRPEWFPHGKWATIQHIGNLLDECAKGVAAK